MEIEKVAAGCITVVVIVFLMGTFPTVAVALTAISLVALFLLERS
jgi:hypothetical protein